MKTIKRRAMAVVMTLVLLAWSGVARGGDIHDAAASGDKGLINVSGKVIDPQRNGVANARVYAFLRSDKADQNKIIKETISSGDGSFKFTDLISPDTRHGYYIFIATATNFAIGWKHQTEKTSLESVEITLGTPGSISGQVVDNKGEPIQDVLVKARIISLGEDFPYGNYLYLPEYISLACNSTDRNGKFTITNLPQQANVSLSLLHKEYYTKDSMRNVSVGAHDLKYTLGSGGVIKGYVTFQETGKPADGISVFCQGQSQSIPHGGYGHAETDAQGQYLLGSLPPGKYNVCVDFPDGQSEWTAAARESVSVPEGVIVENMDIYLIKGGFIIGQVIDLKTKEPIPDVGIGFYGPARPDSGAAIQSVYTGKDGKYKFRGPAGRTKVYICETQYLFPRSQGMQDVEIKSGEVTSGIDFELSAGAMIAGKVIDKNGKAVPDAKVIALAKSTRKENTTDSEGHFSIFGLPQGETVELWAVAGELGMSEPEKVSLQGEPIQNIVLRLTSPSLARLSGRVLDKDGNPLPDVAVSLKIMVPMGSGTWRSSQPRIAMTNDKGEFLFEKLDSHNEFSLAEIRKSGYQFYSGGTMRKGVDGNLFIEDIIMTELSGKLIGSVVDGKNKPAEGAVVFVYDQGVAPNLKTNESGLFEIANLPKGEKWVGAMRGEREYGSMKVTSDDQKVILKLKPIIGKSQQAPTPEEKNLAAELIEEAWKVSAKNEYYARSHLPATLAQIDVDRALDMANESGDTWTRTVLSYRVPDLPADKADRILRTFENNIPVEEIGSMFFDITLKYSKSDPARAKAAFEKGLYLQEEVEGKSTWQAVSFFCKMALAARSLGHQDWQIFAEKAFVRAQSIEDGWKRAFCGELGLLDSEKATKLAETIGDWNTRQHAKSAIVIAVASDDTIKAYELYKVLLKTKGEERDFYISMAGKEVVRQMCKNNLSEAFEIAKTIPEPGQRAQALAIVADATVDTARAEDIYDIAITATKEPGWRSALPEVVRAMRTRYPDKALAIVETRITQDEKNEMDYPQEVFRLAYYIGDIAPNTARSIIENGITRIMSKGSLTNNGQGSLTTAAMAMTRIDLTRAVQITEGLLTSCGSPSVNFRAEALRKISQYLIATEDVRRDLAFDRWSAGDTWTPGEETGW